MTQYSFHENWANSDTGNRLVQYSINRNHIKKLPQKLFESVLSSPATASFSIDVLPICDCEMKYLITEKAKIEQILESLVCLNLHNKALANLEVKDLSKC